MLLSFLNLPAPLPCWGPQEGCAAVLPPLGMEKAGGQGPPGHSSAGLFRLVSHDENYSPGGKAGCNSRLEVSGMPWCQHAGWWLPILRKVSASEGRNQQ